MKNQHSIMGTIVVIFTLTWAFSAHSAALSGAEIARQIDARDEGSQQVRRIHMTMSDADNSTRERETISYRKIDAGTKKTLIYYQKPANFRGTAFLTFDYVQPTKDDDQWLYLPAFGKIRRISSANRGDAFLGTDFSYEDIKKETKFSLEDYRFSVLEQQQQEGGTLYLIEAIPISEQVANELGISRIRSWVDAQIWMPLTVDQWDLNGQHFKTIEMKDIQSIQGIWTPLSIESHNHLTQHHTQFRFSEIDYQQEIDEQLFSQNTLRRGL
jgi:uncharacterized protein